MHEISSTLLGVSRDEADGAATETNGKPEKKRNYRGRSGRGGSHMLRGRHKATLNCESENHRKQ